VAHGADIVRAAGAVLVRDGLVAVVHRPRYDDWTLPKGKHEPGEDDPRAAVREVLEETGHTALIERDLGSIEYRVQRHGATVPKVVRYYLMAAGPGSFTPDDEVDELR
jgi:8-oxo-dGTP pyrophosphatase MutT (NUDIX family)